MYTPPSISLRNVKSLRISSGNFKIPTSCKRPAIATFSISFGVHPDHFAKIWHNMDTLMECAYNVSVSFFIINSILHKFVSFRDFSRISFVTFINAGTSISSLFSTIFFKLSESIFSATLKCSWNSWYCFSSTNGCAFSACCGSSAAAWYSIATLSIKWRDNRLMTSSVTIEPCATNTTPDLL